MSLPHLDVFIAAITPLATASTKARILTLVASRPRTVSELGRLLDINKSAVHRHLNDLVMRGLLTKRACRKWVYYELVAAPVAA